MYRSNFRFRMMTIDDVLNDSVGTAAYALLAGAQITAALRIALNLNSRFSPINNPIRIPFLLRSVFALRSERTHQNTL